MSGPIIQIKSSESGGAMSGTIIELQSPALGSFPVKAEFPIDKTNKGAFRFAIHFVYPKGASPFIIKGDSHECDKWLKKYAVDHPILVHETVWNKGKCYFRWMTVMGLSPNFRAYLLHMGVEDLKKEYDMLVRRKGWLLRVFEKDNELVYELVYQKLMRYAPRSWMKELDHFTT